MPTLELTRYGAQLQAVAHAPLCRLSPFEIEPGIPKDPLAGLLSDLGFTKGP